MMTKTWMQSGASKARIDSRSATLLAMFSDTSTNPLVSTLAPTGFVSA